MGVDLKLLPFEGPSHSGTVLTCERRFDLFDEIAGLTARFGRDVPEEFDSYLAVDNEHEEAHYGVTTIDSYGNPLKCVKAGQLTALLAHEDVIDNPLNRAAWAYLAQLPPDANVAIFWD